MRGRDDRLGWLEAMRRLTCCGLVLVGAAGMLGKLAAAQGRGNATEGLRVARNVCSRCHAVAPRAGGGWTDAPSFESIANRPATTEQWLRSFIQQPHMHMTGYATARAHASDLAAYITTLRHQ